MSSIKSIRVGLTALILVMGGSATRAQEPSSIGVSFAFRAKEFAGGVPAIRRPEMETRISSALAEILAHPSRFPFWSFTRTSADEEPRLSVWIEKVHHQWRLRMTLVTAQGETDTPWDGTLYGPADLELAGGIPEPNSWPRTIAAVFTERLLPENKEKILTALQESVPLGGEVVPVPPEHNPRAVLPLDWDKHCRLADSGFRIVYVWTNEGEVTLHSVGTVSFYPYKGSFKGIVVQHLDWEFAGRQEKVAEHLQDLANLTPKFFYLEKLKRRVQPCSAAATGLAVAR